MSFFLLMLLNSGAQPHNVEKPMFTQRASKEGVGPSEPPFADVCRAEGQFLVPPIPDLVL